MKTKTSRRNFLKGGAALGGLMLLPSWAIGRTIGPNDKLNVAVVGVGGRGRDTVNLVAAAPNANLVALCDVDDNSAAGAYNDHPNVPRFRDYRVMLDKMENDIDAVAVCCTDHMHFPIALWAISKGKHVFCEKPLVRTVWECRKIRDVAKKAGVITQMGNQGHTLNGWRLVKEWNEDGVIGKIKEVQASTDRPFWPQGALSRPAAKPVPDSIDWKLWLGVSPFQEYGDGIMPFNWRGLRNYGTASVGDMACHILDTPISGLGLESPTKIWGGASESNDYSFPQRTQVYMEFDSPHGVDGKIQLSWCDGGLHPQDVERVSQEFVDRTESTSYIVGTKETVTTDCYGNRPMLSDRELMKELKQAGRFDVPSRIAQSEAQHNPQQEWINACIAGKQPMANFDYAAPFCEIALLLLIASNFEDPIEYDSKSMSFKNSPEGNMLLSSMYKYNQEFLPFDVKQPNV